MEQQRSLNRANMTQRTTDHVDFQRPATLPHLWLFARVDNGPYKRSRTCTAVWTRDFPVLRKRHRHCVPSVYVITPLGAVLIYIVVRIARTAAFSVAYLKPAPAYIPVCSPRLHPL